MLNLPLGASQELVKHSFRQLAKIHHPDMGTGSEERFKQINEAYQFLTKHGTGGASDPVEKNPFSRPFYKAPNAGVHYYEPSPNIHSKIFYHHYSAGNWSRSSFDDLEEIAKQKEKEMESLRKIFAQFSRFKWDDGMGV